jgi:formate hydrogenlyase subunit 3/multisubunit Na+/H+ antiporter MnhD subunit
LWSFGLSFLKEAGGTDFTTLSGMLRKYPFASAAVIVALFSVTGLPLLAAFPIREVLLENVAKTSLTVAFWAGLGATAMILGGIRALSALAKGEQTGGVFAERWPQITLLLLGTAVVLLVGIVPGWFLPGLLRILEAYTHLR